MFKRLYLYYHERFPFFTRLLLGFIVFSEIYFDLVYMIINK